MAGPTIDYSHFNKFLSSLGLGLMAMAVIATWAFFQSLDALTLSSTDVEALTLKAREVILQRQTMIGRAQFWLPIGASMLFLLGAALVVAGAVRWLNRQLKDDRALDASYEHQRREYEKASPELVDSQIESEVDELLSADGMSDRQGGDLKRFRESRLPSSSSPSAEAEGRPAGDDPGQAREANAPGIAVQRAEVLEGIRSAESMWSHLMEDAFSSVFTVRSSVAEKRTASEPLRLIDVLLDPPQSTPWGQLAFEVKFTSSTKNLMNRVKSAAAQAAEVGRPLSLGSVYTGRRGRPPAAAVTAIAVVIHTSAKPMDDRLRKNLSDAMEQFNEDRKRPVGAIVISQKALDAVHADELREQISQLWSGSTSLVTLD